MAPIGRARRATLSLGLAALLSACAGVPGEGPVWPDFLRAPADAIPLSAEVRAALALGDAADPAYVIGAEDVLDVAVWRDETLKATLLVRPDGGITFPLVGELQAAGRTAAQLREELTRRLDAFLPEPVVTVTVARVTSQRFYVLGRVARPGDFQVGRSVDVLQALALAGGLTPFAAEDGIRIIRRVQGHAVAIPFQYSRLRRLGDLSQNIPLRSGDVLLVP
jgi:polysaccharide export outer membrane protein